LVQLSVVHSADQQVLQQVLVLKANNNPKDS
jgi:hypothetical protein